MEGLFLILAALSYCVGTVGYLVYLIRDEESVHRISWTVLAIGATFQAVTIVLRSSKEGRLAVTNNQEALAFFAWILVVSYLFLQARFRLRIFGSFVSPLAAIAMFASSLLPDTFFPNSPIFRSGWLIVHIITLFCAYGLFGLAFCGGIMYLIQERNIKRKHFGHLYVRLPSLQRLDRINYVCILAGFPLMTIGLVAGFAYAGMVWHSSWNWDPKEIASLLTWGIYAVLVHERLAVGWRGRRAAWLAIIGFAGVIVTFLGVNLFLKGHHTTLIQ